MVELIGRDWAKLVRFASQARRGDSGTEDARTELGLDWAISRQPRST